MSAPYESPALQSQTAKFTVRPIKTKSARMRPPLTLRSNGVFLKQITFNFFLPLFVAINTLFFQTKEVRSETGLPEFSTQIVKGKRNKFSSIPSLRIPHVRLQDSLHGIYDGQKGTGIFIRKYFDFSCQ